MSEHDFEEPPIRFTNNRKINLDDPSPVTADGGDAPPLDETLAATDELDENAHLLEERTRDLQRLSAEYANYRKRAERERLAAGEIAVGRTLAELLPVVDDLDRARAHGDLSGALKAVADKLDAAFGKLGLVAFGEVGDEFDPSIHEAVLHDESGDGLPSVSSVMRVGFRHGERLLRPAMVGVGNAGRTEAPAPAEQAGPPAEQAGPPAEQVGAPAEQGGPPAEEATDDAVDTEGMQP